MRMGSAELGSPLTVPDDENDARKRAANANESDDEGANNKGYKAPLAEREDSEVDNSRLMEDHSGGWNE